MKRNFSWSQSTTSPPTGAALFEHDTKRKTKRSGNGRILGALTLALGLILAGAGRLSAQNVSNYNFEAPPLGDNSYNGLQPTLAQSGWYFLNASDIQLWNSSIARGLSQPKYGTQVLRLGGLPSYAANEKWEINPGMVEQYVNGISADTTYQLVIDAQITPNQITAQRSYGNSIIASWDTPPTQTATPIKWSGRTSITPTTGTWTTYISEPFKLSAGKHFLFVSTKGAGTSFTDVFIDNISLYYTPVPKPRQSKEKMLFANSGYSLWGPNASGFDRNYLLGGSWGPNGGSAGGFWNPRTPDVDFGLFTIPGFSLGETGFSASASTYGQDCGLNLVAGASGGTIDVNYPIGVTLTYPDTVLAGRTFTVNTAWAADPDSKVETQLGAAYLKAIAQLNAGFHLDATAKAFGKTLFDGSIIDFTPNFSQTLFETNLLFASGYVPSSKEDALLHSKAKSYPKEKEIVTARIQLPYVHTMGSPGSVNDYKRNGTETINGTPVSLSYLPLDPPAAALTNPNASYARDMDALLGIKGDITNLIATSFGLEPWNRSFGRSAGPLTLKAELSLLDLYLSANINLLQEATFLPTPQITLTTDDGQSVTGDLGKDLVLKMPTNGKPINITPSVNFNNSFINSTYLAFTGGIYFDVFKIAAQAKAGVDLGEFTLAPVPTFGVEGSIPVSLDSKNFTIPFDSQTGETFQVSQSQLPTAANIDVEAVDGTYIGNWNGTYQRDGLYYWPAGLHKLEYPSNSPYYTEQPTFLLRVLGDQGPLPGAPGGQPGTTQLIWDKGEPTEKDLSGSVLDASATISSNLITPGIHHITAISSSFTFSQTSTMPVEIRAFRPILWGLYAPTTSANLTYVTSLQAGSAETTLVVDAQWIYAGISQAFLDDEPLPLLPVAGPGAPLVYLDPSVQSKYYAVPLPAFALADGGTHTFKIVTEGPGGGNSIYKYIKNNIVYTGTAYTLTTVNPVPTIRSLSVTSATVLDPATSFSIAGSGFVPSSKVTVNGTAISTQFQSSTGLEAQIPTSLLKTVGALNIAVVNPSKDSKGNTIGGGTSSTLTFTVKNPVPSLVTLTTPKSTGPVVYVDRNSSGFTLKVRPAASSPVFPYTAVINVGGNARTTTIARDGSLASCLVLDSDLTSTRAIPITITNPAPGGGTSQPLTLQVIYPKPGISSIDPLYTNSFETTIRGAGFYDTSTVLFNGENVAVQSVSSNAIKITVPGKFVDRAYTATIEVRNPTTVTFPDQPAGSPQTDGGTSDPMAMTAKKAQTNYTITSSKNPAKDGDTITLTLTLTSPGGYVLPGTVQMAAGDGSTGGIILEKTLNGAASNTFTVDYQIRKPRNGRNYITFNVAILNKTVQEGNSLNVTVQ